MRSSAPASPFAASSRVTSSVRVLAWDARHRPPYLVLERLGATLDATIPDSGMAAHEALEVLRDVATAVAAFHETGRCHNDLKPENVLREERQLRWKVIDPAPMLIASHYYPNPRILGPPRDLIALARLFLTALFGVEREDLDEQEIEYLARTPLLHPLIGPLQLALCGDGSVDDVLASIPAGSPTERH